MKSVKKASFILIGIGLLILGSLGLFQADWPVLAAPSQGKHSSELVFMPWVQKINPPIKFIQHNNDLISYEGAFTCLECHEEEVHDFAVSNHYLWRGKIDSINDFCSYPNINFGLGRLTNINGNEVNGGCVICHAGMGELPSSENPENADCLLCHAEEYQRMGDDTAG